MTGNLPRKAVARFSLPEPRSPTMSINALKPTSTAILASSLTQELKRFREQLEAEAGEPAFAIETNAALLLSDLCKFFKLGSSRCDRILGRQAASNIAATLETEVFITDERLLLPSGSDTVVQAYEPRN
jgi:hypothetical protein